MLVTGIHRSGSTWVGKVFSSAPGVGYIEEPFRRNQRRGIKVDNGQFWCPYFQVRSRYPFQRRLRARLMFHYDTLAALRGISSKRLFARVMADIAHYTWHRLKASRALVKDPTLFFSAEWFAETFDAQVVVLVRHPAAFAESLSRTGPGWRWDFTRFLAQPALLSKFPPCLREEIRDQAAARSPVLEEAALLWRLFYYIAVRYREEYPNWLFLRHEDLCLAPFRMFPTAFRALGLRFGGQAQRFLARTTDARNPIDAPGRSTNFQTRNSRAVATKWKSRLSRRQIDSLRGKVESVSRHFYEDSDW